VADEINLDTSAAIAFVSEGSPVRHHLKALVAGKGLVLTATAEQEFEQIVMACGGPWEQARALRLMKRARIVADNPSARARQLRPTRNLGPPDILILGTGDAMGAPTLTADRRAVMAARAQGVHFQVILHQPVPLKGA
jgi:plasmid stabilization system protein ParE